MKKVINTIAAAAIVMVFASCSLSAPFLLTNNKIGDKKGVSTTVSLFGGGLAYTNSAPVMGRSVYNGIMLNPDFGIPEAAKKGKIQKIATVDIRYDWYFFFTKKTFIVTGE